MLCALATRIFSGWVITGIKKRTPSLAVLYLTFVDGFSFSPRVYFTRVKTGPNPAKKGADVDNNIDVSQTICRTGQTG